MKVAWKEISIEVPKDEMISAASIVLGLGKIVEGIGDIARKLRYEEDDEDVLDGEEEKGGVEKGGEPDQ